MCRLIPLRRRAGCFAAQQTIRDILEAGAVSIVTRDFELAETLAALGKCPKLVITDSQIFGKVSKIVPEDIPLTSFSILMAAV